MQNQNTVDEDLAPLVARETAYDQDKATEYDAYRFTDAAGKAIHQAEKNCLFRALQQIPSGAHVMEVGCGTGRLLVEVANLGYRVDGADASGAMLEETKKKFRDHPQSPQLLLCGAAEIPVDDNTYDFTYSIRLLNQTESPEYALQVIKEMIRITRPSGYCLIEFVNEYRPRLGLNQRPTTRLRPEAALASAQEAGAQLVAWDGAFLVSMQAYKKTPRFLLGATVLADRLLSKCFPKRCSRTYLFVKKRPA